MNGGNICIVGCQPGAYKSYEGPHHRTYVLDITDNLVVRIESALPQIDVSLAHSLYFD